SILPFPDFIDKFVWAPSKDIAADGAAEPKNDPTICAFSPASQLGGMELSEFRSLNHDEDLPEEPSICLFTQYEGCHEIIDSMIQSVASLLNADAVVLDALGLALGEFGVLGTGTNYYCNIGFSRKSDLSRIQAAFNAILTVSNKVQPCTGVDLTEASKRRFIYLRDLGSIARSVKPFMARLLHATRVRRSAAYENENHSAACGIHHPTALPAAFFLPPVPKSSGVNTTALSLAQNSVIPALREECICLIPKNFQQNAIRDLTRCAKIKRKKDVPNMQQGFLVVADLNSAVSADTSSGDANQNNALWSDVLSDRPDIRLPIAVSRIVTIAIGLAHQRLHAQTPIRIDAEDIFKAHAIFIEHSRTFSHWVDETSRMTDPANQTQSLLSDEDNKDTIVENVKNCKDLNEHDKALLPCIVDCVSLTTKFDNVCIDTDIIQSLKDIVSFPLKYPAIGGVLLYGPPGTGKTMVCRALARECGARMLQVRPSNVVNKWVGESEKLAQNVFNLAHRLAPCIVFFDEIDSMFRSRTSDDRHHTRNTVSGLYAGIVVVGATNRVSFRSRRRVLRRLPTRLLVKLPDETRRKGWTTKCIHAFCFLTQML
ncbi:hypothetical protein DFH09DRAFT_1167251, partial [Mycena vulgaris]